MEATRPDAISGLSVESQRQAYGGEVCRVDGIAVCPPFEGAKECKQTGCTGNPLEGYTCDKDTDGKQPEAIHTGGNYKNVSYSTSESGKKSLKAEGETWCKITQTCADCSSTLSGTKCRWKNGAVTNKEDQRIPTVPDGDACTN